MKNRHHLAPVPDNIDRDAAVLAMIEIVGDLHFAKRILDGSLVMDHSTDTIIATDIGDPEAVADLDQDRRAALTNVATVGDNILAVEVATTTGHETVAFVLNGWRCTCDVFDYLELGLPDHEDDTCTHIATVSVLVRHNPPPQLADLPAALLQAIRDHHDARGY